MPNSSAKEIFSQSRKKTIGYFQLFQFSTSLDKLCIFIGTICAIINGLAFPILMNSLGDCIESIIEYASSVDRICQKGNNSLLKTMNHKLWIHIVQSILASFATIISAYLSVVLFSYSGTRQIFKIRKMFLEKMLYQDMSWFDLNHCVDVSTTLTKDISKMEEGISDLIAFFLYLATTIVTAVVFGLIFGWKIALVGLLSFPIFMTTSLGITWLTTKLSAKEMESQGAAGAVAEEVLSSIKTVIAFGGEEKEKCRYEKHLIKAKNFNIKRNFFDGFSRGIYIFLGYSGFALAFWLGATLILKDTYLPVDERVYTPKTLLAIFFTILLAFWNWEFVPEILVTFATATGAAQKVFLILNTVPTIERNKNVGKDLNAFCSSIIFENVFFNYPSRPDVKVIQGFNLKINKGDIIALVGSSGCGKTTIIQLLQRFYDPLQGKIFIDNIDLRDLNSTSLQQTIAVVGQEPALFNTTIYENIRYGKITASREEIENAAIKANVHTFILSLPNGYQTVLGERGTQISGGQKQKIAIARALVKKPQILLLDEATSALDSTNETEVQKGLNSIIQDCTTIIVAHRLSTIKRANRIAVIKEGKVWEVGSHVELLERKGEYYNLVNSQKFIGASEKVTDERKMYNIEGTNNAVSINDNDGELLEVENVGEEVKSKNVLYKIIKLNLSEWNYVLPGCISAVISGTAKPFYGIILGNIVQAFSNKNYEELIFNVNTNCLYFLILGIGIGTSTFLQTTSLNIACEKLSLKIRSESFDAMLNQEMGWFDRKENGVGSLCAQLAGDASSFQGVSGYQLGMICQILSLLTLSFAVSFYYEWRVTLVLLTMSLILLIASYFQQKSLKYDAKKNIEMLEVSAKIAVEAISNIRTIASLGCEKVFLDQYIKELLHYQKTSRKKSHIRGFIIGFMNSLVIFSYPVGLWYGVKLIVEENIQYGNVFTVCEIIVIGLWSAGNMMAACPNFQKGIIAASRVMRLLERVPSIKNHTNYRKVSLGEESLNYSKIYFSYPTRPSTLILKNFSLRIPNGKTVALVGSSGSGKSTVIQLLQRFYDPNSGEIIVNNKDIRQMDLKALRSQWGVVSQEPNLFNKTIAENIAYGANFKIVEKDDIIKAAKGANIHNFIVGLPKGYETKIGSKGSHLSGGQKQRIAIARALIRNPQILLLDEATSALDNDNEKIVQEALDKSRKGRTCITIAHRLTTIQDADIICVLDGGFIKEMGTHEDLIKLKGMYYIFYELQRQSLIN